MKPRDFVYVGEPIPKMKPEFLLNLQKSMLLSLVKRGLLTTSQMDEVICILEKQYKKTK